MSRRVNHSSEVCKTFNFYKGNGRLYNITNSNKRYYLETRQGHCV